MIEIHVAAAILWKDGLILAAQRPAGDARAGCWEFPGGTMEPGETPEACLERELEEELALRVRVQELYREVTHDYPDLRVHLLVYTCEVLSGNATARVHQALRWLAPQELDQLRWSTADQPIVEALIKEHAR